MGDAMSLKETLTCLGCMILLLLVAFIIYLMVALIKVYGPLLLLGGLVIYGVYATLRHIMQRLKL